MIPQVAADAIISGLEYALMGLGFAFIYSSTRVFHFDYGAIYSWGAYLAYTFTVVIGCNSGIGVPLAAISAVLIGCGLLTGIYQRMSKMAASGACKLVASIGVYAVLQAFISMFFGEDLKPLRGSPVQVGALIFGARVTPVQFGIASFTLLAMVGAWCFLRLTKPGLLLRAVVDQVNLARTLGIRTDLVSLTSFGIGSALAGTAGIFLALDVGITPEMGFSALLFAVVTVIVGGVGSITGLFLSGLLIGAAQHIGVWRIATQWQQAITFGILIIFLLLRPQGFLGKPLRRPTV